MEPDKFREFLMRGAVVCVQLTPFKKNEDVDYEGLKENTRVLIEKSRGEPLVLVPAGSTGEKLGEVHIFRINCLFFLEESP